MKMRPMHVRVQERVKVYQVDRVACFQSSHRIPERKMYCACVCVFI